MAAIPGPSLSPAAGSNSEHFDYHFLSSQLVAKEKILPKRKFCPRSHRVLALSNFPSSQLIASLSGGFCLLGNSCHFDFSRKKTLKAFGSMVCRCRNESSFDPIDSSNDGGEWDFRSPYKQFQAAAGKMAEPFRHMMNIAGKKIQDYLEGYKGGNKVIKGKK